MLKKSLIMIAVLVSLLIFGLTIASAQGPQNNPQRGGRAQTSTNNQSGDCISNSQLNDYPGTNATNRASGQGHGQMKGGNTSNGGGILANLPPAYEGDPPQDVIDLMIEGWLDEQHAFAAYESIMAQFGDIAPFVNIQRAEAQHAATWETLFARYDIPMPDVTAFDIPQFDSPQEACALGAEAEILNFSLYDEMLETFAPYPDIQQVAQALRDASEFNHLPAFEACAGS